MNNENDENINEYLIDNNQTISDFNDNNNNNIKQNIQISQSKHSSYIKEKI